MGTLIVQSVLSGIAIGLVYGIVALCIGIVFNSTKVLNFAQGEFIMFGAVFTWLGLEWGLPYGIAMLVGVFAGGALAFLTDLIVISPVRRANPPMWTYVFLLMGVHYVASEAISLWLGSSPMSAPSIFGDRVIRIGGAAVSAHYYAVIATAVIMLGAIYVVLKRTSLGRAMRATATNILGASIVGLDVRMVSRKAFTLCGVLSALVGAIALPITSASAGMGLALTLKGFMAAIIGGLGDLRGALVGGLLVGVGEALLIGVFSYRWAEALIWGTFALVLLALPNGVFGTLVEDEVRV